MIAPDPSRGPVRPRDRASLVCRVAARLCALPLSSVIETMRALPIEPIAGAPEFIAGFALVRGEAVPVVDATRLLGGQPGPARRFVTVRGARSVIAIAVEAVLAVRELGGDGLAAVTPLAGAIASDVIAAIGTLDAQLLVVLETAHLVPDSVLAAVERAS